jgi:uncharacterized protein YkwD
MKKNKIARKYYKKYLSLSLLLVLIGIFLMPKTAYLTTINQDSIISLSNEERQKKGLDPLEENKILSQAAYEKGRAIFKSQTFKHEIENKKFSYWIKKAGYEYSYVGENLAIDFITAEGVVKAWLGSKTHQDNLLSKDFSEIGVAVMDGEFNGKKTVLVVQIFGSPVEKALPVISSAEDLKARQVSVPISPANMAVPAGAENSLLHAGSLTEKNYGINSYSYLPPSPFELSAYSLILEMIRFPEKWLFMLSVILLFSLAFYLIELKVVGGNLKIIAKKTKRSKPAPI